MNRHDRRRLERLKTSRAKIHGKEVEVRDAPFPVQMIPLGLNYRGPEVLGVNCVVEAIHQYPNGSTESLGLCYIVDEDGNRLDTTGPVVIAGPSNRFDDPRNITPEGVRIISEDLRPHMHRGPNQPQ